MTWDKQHHTYVVLRPFGCSRPRQIQVKTKYSQIQQNPAKPEQRKSKEKAWISLDCLVRIERFQGVALTPWAIFSLSRSFAALDGRVSGVKNARRVRRARLFALCGDVRHGQCTLSRIPIFSKEEDAKEFSRPATGLLTRGGCARFTQRFQIPPPSRTQLAEMHGSALRNSRREAAAVAPDTVGSERPDLFRSAGSLPLR